ncbi:MAG: hypothetical protein ACOY5Y_02370 [Pseudomonadota bacterium]
MPGPRFHSDPGSDPQDGAETFDESQTVGGEGSVSLGGDSPLPVGEEMRTFEELPDVRDVTRREGDADDDEAIALDADEFDPDAVQDRDFEEDNELDYRAATAEREDDIDGLGPEGGRGDEDRLAAGDIEGLDEVRDADAVEGGEDDFTNFEAKNLDDADLERLGYSGRPKDRG